MGGIIVFIFVWYFYKYQYRHTISQTLTLNTWMYSEYNVILDEMLLTSLNLRAIIMDLECSGSVDKSVVELFEIYYEKHLQFLEIRQWEIAATVLYWLCYLVSDIYKSCILGPKGFHLTTLREKS